MMEKNSIRDEVGWDNSRKNVERFVTTVVNQLPHVAGCLRRMKCRVRPSWLVILPGRMYRMVVTFSRMLRTTRA